MRNRQDDRYPYDVCERKALEAALETNKTQVMYGRKDMYFFSSEDVPGWTPVTSFTPEVAKERLGVIPQGARQGEKADKVRGIRI